MIERARVRRRRSRRIVCCGRPLISQGLLDEARDARARTPSGCSRSPKRGQPIVFFEPSCLSAIREDAPDLLAGEERRHARVVADRSRLFEDWLEAECRSGAAAAAFTPGPRRSCFTATAIRSRWATSPPAKALLARIPGATIVDPDAGCCGMAGSFGYMQ